ncbi:MAG TPA: GNAT family N-acetyltransferase [Pyrinomonadaceae bacterium]|nr:GNAT family N-acetyltransferase [Chloracidobacterium sp.]MBP9934921.1 GNAT family N-acetyltransferase [Pyrinomonadaceae bacterium]MBK7803349.1 GNAT family N-acetyltransferase [Chloracidobacterium sp.]MBK9438597.1 GNAT family N-acetyltransferase [Chloracidobacterium sp.]MBK9766646.1 GNAT family N-acetyltransferase [Chloracidobacterium sp.]
MTVKLDIRECTTLEQLGECVDLQREVFALPEVELSPVRHFVVTKNAGGFTLGAFDGDRLAGYVLSVPAFLRGEKAFYSHMTGVRSEYQSLGVGARLKWAQRERALSVGVKYIKWTFEPVKARNGYFNLEKLGAIVSEYQRNFYGTDYAVAPESGKQIGLQSDRLFAEWDLESEKVRALGNGEKYVTPGEPEAEVRIIDDWPTLVEGDPAAALELQLRVRREFEAAFADGLVGRAFRRDPHQPAYLLYRG